MKLDSLLQEFQGTDPEEALELLMDLGDKLPPLSAAREAVGLVASCRVQECQTPVYLWVDVVDGKLRLEAQVPEKSPTVRGLVSLLVTGLEGWPVDQLNRIPDDLLPALGLDQALGMQRRHGMRGIVARIKREAVRAAATEASSDQ
ncbi:MAG: SufE family protein [Planctomycetaceae bacterium]|nr:MAG: SufE family protein [Planctomycetaceae bacterium]